MAYYMETAKELKKRFADQFPELNAQQLWTLVRFAKTIRWSCRNNDTFNLFCNEIFPHASFKTVTKTKKDNTTYPGLAIVVAGKAVEEDADDE